MMERWLLFCANAALQHPWRVIAMTIAPCIALSVVGASSPRDLSFTGVMDRSHPLVARYFAQSDEVNFAGRLPLLLESAGPPEALDAAMDALTPVLQALPSVAAVTSKAPLDWFEQNAPYLVPQGVFDDWVRLATHPEDTAGARRFAKAMATMQESLATGAAAGTTSKSRLLVVQLRDDPMNLPAGGGTFLEIDRVTQTTLQRFPGVEGAYAGLPAVSAQDQSRTMGKVQILSPLSFLLVLLLFRLLERRLSRIGAVALPMMLSVGATLGIVGMLTGVITVMETFFGVMVFGLGIDFAVLLMTRLREELALGAAFPEALMRTWRGAGRGVISGGMTTAGAFLIVALAPDPLARHLGLAGGIGLMVCLLLMLLLLPAAWVALERRAHSDAPPPSAKLRFIERVTRHAVRHPRVHIVGALLVVGVACLGMPRYRYETDLAKVFNRDVPALAVIEKLQKRFEINASPWTVVAEDLADAQEIVDRFTSSERFSRVESGSQLLRPDAEARQHRLQAHRPDIDAQRQIYEGLRPLTSDEDLPTLDGATKALRVLQHAAAQGPPTLESLPPELRASFFTRAGRPVVFAYVKEPTIDGALLQAEREAVEKLHPNAVSFGFLLEAIMSTDRPWAVWVLLGILLHVSCVLVLDFRNVRYALIALAPVLFATATTFGLLCWADLGFNVLTTVVVPLIIGLGVDAGIHVVHRLREDDETDRANATAAVGRAIWMTTATTCSSFMTLLFADHPGLESMALVLLVGLPLCLWASITLVPALATAFPPKSQALPTPYER